jgi:hypothetical protein
MMLFATSLALAFAEVSVGEREALIRVSSPGIPALPSVERTTYRQAVVETGPGYQTLRVVSGGRFSSLAPYPLDQAKIPSSATPYLRPTPSIQSENAEIAAHAAALVRGSDKQEDAVWKVLAWVMDNLTYDAGLSPNDALSVWDTRRARCAGYSALSAALLRAAGIPTRLATGLMLGDSTGSGLHEWIEVWYPDHGWVPCEPQGEFHSVPPTYIFLSARADGAQWHPSLASLAVAMEKAAIQVTRQADASEMVDVRRTPAIWARATGDEGSIQGATLKVRVTRRDGRPLGAGGFDLFTGGRLGASLPFGTGESYDLSSWEAAPESGQVLLETDGAGRLTLAGLAGRPVGINVNLPGSPGVSLEAHPEVGRVGYIDVLMEAGGTPTVSGSGVQMSMEGSCTLVLGDVASGGPAQLGLGPGGELRIYISSTQWYPFGAPDLKAPMTFYLPDLPAAGPGRLPALRVEGHTLQLLGVAPGQVKMGLVLPGRGEQVRTVEVSRGEWTQEPLLWRDGVLLQGAEAERYLVRLSRLTLGLVTVEVGGRLVPSDVNPIIVRDRVLLPLRAVCEAAGAEVTWHPVLQEAHVRLGTTSLVVKPGSDSAWVNGITADLDVPPLIQEGRILVPVRFLGENLGFSVSWIPGWRTVTLD